jgi:anti-sigma regulatory factor (Ser/Thr protein kinase)
MSAFPEVRSFVEEACQAAAFGPDDCARLVLLLEELFTNTVVHGHGGDSDAAIEVGLDVTPGGIALRYEDSAPPHNPFASMHRPEEGGGVEERRVGGLGVVLVASMSDRVEYGYAQGRNRISVTMTRST